MILVNKRDRTRSGHFRRGYFWSCCHFPRSYLVLKYFGLHTTRDMTRETRGVPSLQQSTILMLKMAILKVTGPAIFTLAKVIFRSCRVMTPCRQVGGIKVSEKHIASIFKVEVQPWIWRQYVPPIRWYPSTRLNGIITQKTAILIFPAVWLWNIGSYFERRKIKSIWKKLSRK
jgi:hypothetical protein